MSLHQLAGISPNHPGSLSCLLYFLCVLAIPIFPLFKFEEFLIYLYIYILPLKEDNLSIIPDKKGSISMYPRFLLMCECINQSLGAFHDEAINHSRIDHSEFF